MGKVLGSIPSKSSFFWPWSRSIGSDFFSPSLVRWGCGRITSERGMHADWASLVQRAKDSRDSIISQQSKEYRRGNSQQDTKKGKVVIYFLDC